jgi:hypothetical protein
LHTNGLVRDDELFVGHVPVRLQVLGDARPRKPSGLHREIGKPGNDYSKHGLARMNLSHHGEFGSRLYLADLKVDA